MRVHVPPEVVLKAFELYRNDPSFSGSAKAVAAGRLPAEMVQAMSLRPTLLKVLAAFGEDLYPGGLLPHRLKELVILQASVLNACQFCTNAHVSMIRQLGMSPQPLSLIEDLSGLDERERLAVEYTRAAVADSARIPAALVARLKQAFTDPELVELTAVIGMIQMLNTFNNCLDVTYRGEYDQPAGA